MGRSTWTTFKGKSSRHFGAIWQWFGRASLTNWYGWCGARWRVKQISLASRKGNPLALQSDRREHTKFKAKRQLGGKWGAGAKELGLELEAKWVTPTAARQTRRQAEKMREMKHILPLLHSWQRDFIDAHNTPLIDAYTGFHRWTVDTWIVVSSTMVCWSFAKVCARTTSEKKLGDWVISQMCWSFPFQRVLWVSWSYRFVNGTDDHSPSLSIISPFPVKPPSTIC